LHSSTEAGGGSFILGGPAIVGKINHGEARVVEGIHSLFLLMFLLTESDIVTNNYEIFHWFRAVNFELNPHRI
jgi:hypothetical protein